VPGDLSVIGFDDLEVAPYVGLTTVHQPLEDSGRRGIERLVGSLDGDDTELHEERFDLELVVRRTTAPPTAA
jgi:LacI family transcriptional regulator